MSKQLGDGSQGEVYSTRKEAIDAGERSGANYRVIPLDDRGPKGKHRLVVDSKEKQPQGQAQQAPAPTAPELSTAAQRYALLSDSETLQRLAEAGFSAEERTRKNPAGVRTFRLSATHGTVTFATSVTLPAALDVVEKLEEQAKKLLDGSLSMGANLMSHIAQPDPATIAPALAPAPEFSEKIAEEISSPTPAEVQATAPEAPTDSCTNFEQKTEILAPTTAPEAVQPEESPASAPAAEVWGAEGAARLNLESEPVAYQWPDVLALTVEDVQAMPADIYAKHLDKLEDINHHTEALMLECLRAGQWVLAQAIAHLVRYQDSDDYRGLNVHYCNARMHISDKLRWRELGTITPEAQALLTAWGLGHWFEALHPPQRSSLPRVRPAHGTSQRGALPGPRSHRQGARIQ